MKRFLASMAALAVFAWMTGDVVGQPGGRGDRGGRPGTAPGGFPGGGRPGFPGGDRGGFPGGGRFPPPPKLGEILPDFAQNELRLTEKQKKQIAEIQKEVNAKLERLLTEEQRKMLKEMRERRGRPPFGGGRPPFGGRPEDRPDRPGRPEGGAALDTFIQRLMNRDTNKDGKLSKDELPTALRDRLFELADVNKDNVLDKNEIRKLAEKLARGRGGREGDGGGRPDRPDRPGRPDGN